MPLIHSLRLTDFRSYGALDLSFDGRPVVLYGSNGAGKTNLLEAISLLSPGRGLRRAKPGAIARHTPEGQARSWGVVAHISGHQHDDEYETKLAVGQVPEYPRRRSLRINDKPATGGQLASFMPMMWLTPAQDRLFTGPASDRRKFLDRFCLAHAPGHGANFLRYEKARAERNRLLSDGIMDEAWHRALETDMAHFGAQVARVRARTLAALISEIKSRPEGPFPKADISLQGDAEEAFLNGRAVDDVQVDILAQLSQDRPNDLRAGRTLRGVHRSDLLVRHAPKNMPAEACSTGEQKSLLIGLVLAQARAQAQIGPLLLLDEVAAHLDEQRRAAMIEELLALGTQAFLTGTDGALFAAFKGRAQCFTFERGVLVQT
jgi:DNA replication and repair protein RecF